MEQQDFTGAEMIFQRSPAVIGQDGAVLAGRNAVQHMAEIREPLIPGVQIMVLPCGIPQHAPPVVGVLPAGHTDLIPVIQERCSRQQHLHRCREAELAPVLAGAAQKPARIVTVDQIPQNRQHGTVILPLEETLAREEFRRADFAVADERRDILEERVVHNGVPLISLQEFRCEMPDLPDKERVGVNLLHGPAELLPERVANLIPDVQPPAVDVKLTEVIRPDVYDILRRLRILEVQLRHVALVGKALVRRLAVMAAGIQGQPVDMIPVPIGRLPAILTDILKGEKFRRRVVEHTVQHDAQPQGVRGVNEAVQVVCRTERWIDFVVVDCVIFMGGIRAEDRRQVHDVNSQIL